MFKKTGIVITILSLVLASVAWAAVTKIRNATIVSSTVDSSPVGSISPSTGVFTSLTDNNGVPYQKEIVWATAYSSQTGGFSCAVGTAACVDTIFNMNHTLTRFVFFVSQVQIGCSVQATVGIRDVTSSSNLQSVTLNQGTGTFVDSGVISVAVAAGHRLQMGVLTSASGCTSPAILASASATLQ